MTDRGRSGQRAEFRSIHTDQLQALAASGEHEKTNHKHWVLGQQGSLVDVDVKRDV